MGASIRAIRRVAVGIVNPQEQVDQILTSDDPSLRALQWPYDEFAPIAAAIDRLMEARKWAGTKTD